MAEAERLHPVELIRNILLSVERLASATRAPGDLARVAAESAVRGASDELKTRFPDTEEALAVLVRDGMQVLARLAHEAAEHPPAPGQWSRSIAEGVVRGTTDALQEAMPGFQQLTEQLISQINHALDNYESATREKALLMRQPGERSHSAARGAVSGALDEVHRLLPQLAEDLRALGPMGEEIATRVGRGLTKGLGVSDGRLSDATAIAFDRAGRNLVAAVADQLRAELGSAERVAQLMERASAGAVKGASEELGRQIRHWGRALKTPLLVAGALGALLITGFAFRLRPST